MESTDIRQIQAAIRDQAFIGNARVSCPMGRVVAKRREKGATPGIDLRLGRWYSVECVTLERQFTLPDRRLSQTSRMPASGRLRETRCGLPGEYGLSSRVATGSSAPERTAQTVTHQFFVKGYKPCHQRAIPMMSLRLNTLNG